MSQQRSIHKETVYIEIDVEFDRVTAWTRDRHYGADADGNRGKDVTFIDDDYAENITVVDMDGETREFKKLSTETQKVVEDAIDHHIRCVRPTPPDELEPDYDDKGD